MIPYTGLRVAVQLKDRLCRGFIEGMGDPKPAVYNADIGK
jgi:hypothetical protein